jgi:hypothetical protein
MFTDHVKLYRESIKLTEDVFEFGSEIWMFLLESTMSLFVMGVCVTQSFNLNVHLSAIAR